MKHYHTIRVRYSNKGSLGCASVTIKSFDSNELVRLRYNLRYRDALEQACQYLKDKGFNLVGVSYIIHSSDYIILSDTFKSIKG